MEKMVVLSDGLPLTVADLPAVPRGAPSGG